MKQSKVQINFPDLDKFLDLLKSNEIAILGYNNQIDNIENARSDIRMMIPLTFAFKIPLKISLPQIPRQETFWASAGFESTEESVTLSDAPHRLAILTYFERFNFYCLGSLIGKKRFLMIRYSSIFFGKVFLASLHSQHTVTSY